ncbi:MULTISPECIES: hypothetical protein [Bacillus]|uniref:hypothetical protein n=1 Tax=Bacillus TaxID=1386 RepID=UPI0002F59D78|nr:MULTISPECIES: hypothetical protein [Bacillus]
MTNKNTEYLELLNEINKCIEVNPELLNRLSKFVFDLEEERQQLHDAAGDTENELSKSADTIIDLKSENQDLLAENHRLQENVRSYIRDSELSTSTNNQLRSMMEEKHKENVTLRAALKAVL